ncbi:D-alanyl-D-alanine carboxypeptidase family protein [Chitinimonas sp. BJB300]|uniref:D-alanyl-D-alanine carboxypeptidase family protein n=1 Tax=Chitinimonas sp. BJB300 TaxID=1559339 RepID=UPI000C0E9C0C|nr:D-alanyl-D-alanine carboxypeptidase family protein [Chitinimonas sp. BJB300]PHV12305.1 peptidase [Chitinimonas sp. BJB300]TSJ88166.1 D-alanyl-D-alanine carboxypeptidase [Chitinimonas sp. BJB300]
MKISLIALAAAFSLNAAAALSIPPAPDLSANAYFLLDVNSGAPLAVKNPDARIEPASLTKLMTAYLTFKAIQEGRLKPEQQFTVSEKGWKTEGSRMFLDPKKPVSVNDMIKGMIVQSGNDACVTLAEAIAGSEDTFATLMNQQATKLGMKNTHFMNATGLPHAQHYTTARDLAALATAIIRDYPQYYPIYSMKEYRYNNITQPNRNQLLYRDPQVDGMKTGHTDSAGYCLVASKKADGRRVLSVLLGTNSDRVRTDESARLLGYGIQFFDSPRLYAARTPVTQARVFKGQADNVAVGFDRDQYLTIGKGGATKVQQEITLQPKLIAPIKAGQVIGSIKLSLDGQSLGELPLKALAAVPEAGFFGRMVDSTKLWFN